MVVEWRKKPETGKDPTHKKWSHMADTHFFCLFVFFLRALVLSTNNCIAQTQAVKSTPFGLQCFWDFLGGWKWRIGNKARRKSHKWRAQNLHINASQILEWLLNYIWEGEPPENLLERKHLGARKDITEIISLYHQRKQSLEFELLSWKSLVDSLLCLKIDTIKY